MTEYRLVIESGEGGVPHVTRVPVVQFKLIGAAEPDSSPEEARDELMFALRDQGLGPEPVLSYSTDGDGAQVPHLDWPEVGAHAVDPDHARLLTLASLPLGRVVPELDATPETDPEAEAELERVAHLDRQDWAFVAELAEAAATTLHGRRAAVRRLSRSRPSPPKAKSSPGVFLDGERDETGWHWTQLVPNRRRARARIRPPRNRP